MKFMRREKLGFIMKLGVHRYQDFETEMKPLLKAIHFISIPFVDLMCPCLYPSN